MFIGTWAANMQVRQTKELISRFLVLAWPDVRHKYHEMRNISETNKSVYLCVFHRSAWVVTVAHLRFYFWITFISSAREPIRWAASTGGILLGDCHVTVVFFFLIWFFFNFKFVQVCRSIHKGVIVTRRIETKRKFESTCSNESPLQSPPSFVALQIMSSLYKRSHWGSLANVNVIGVNRNSVRRTWHPRATTHSIRFNEIVSPIIETTISQCKLLVSIYFAFYEWIYLAVCIILMSAYAI